MERRRERRRGSRPGHLHGATARRRENLRTQRHRRGHPRAPISEQAARARHDFLAALFDELGGVDGWLNALDRASSTANAARRTELHAFGRKLTYYPRNVEDLSGPLGLRERISDAIARASTSLQPPTAAQVAEATVLKELYDRLSTEYAQLMKP